jgi:hypothetical protein
LRTATSWSTCSRLNRPSGTLRCNVGERRLTQKRRRHHASLGRTV